MSFVGLNIENTNSEIKCGNTAKRRHASLNRAPHKNFSVISFEGSFQCLATGNWCYFRCSWVFSGPPSVVSGGCRSPAEYLSSTNPVQMSQIS